MPQSWSALKLTIFDLHQTHFNLFMGAFGVF